jgi:hypothetical protein
MSGAKRARTCRRCTRNAGAFVVEFAIIVAVFLTFLFGVLEIARYIFVVNTLQEVTRRAASAAANVDFTDQAAMNRVRQHAIFRTSSGPLVLGYPVSDNSIRIDYLALVDGTSIPTPITAGLLPSSTGRNRFICKGHPNDPSCVRFVRVRVCDPAVTDECKHVVYATIFPFISFPVNLPMSLTIMPAETLGFTEGMTASM